MIRLAQGMQDQGNFREAEGLYRQSLEGVGRICGVQHPDVTRL